MKKRERPERDADAKAEAKVQNFFDNWSIVFYLALAFFLLGAKHLLMVLGPWLAVITFYAYLFVLAEEVFFKAKFGAKYHLLLIPTIAFLGYSYYLHQTGSQVADQLVMPIVLNAVVVPIPILAAGLV